MESVKEKGLGGPLSLALVLKIDIEKGIMSDKDNESDEDSNDEDLALVANSTKKFYRKSNFSNLQNNYSKFKDRDKKNAMF